MTVLSLLYCSRTADRRRQRPGGSKRGDFHPRHHAFNTSRFPLDAPLFTWSYGKRSSPTNIKTGGFEFLAYGSYATTVAFQSLPDPQSFGHRTRLSEWRSATPSRITCVSFPLRSLS